MKNRREFILEMVGTLSLTAIVDQTAWAISPAKRAIDSHAHVFLKSLSMAQHHRYVPDYDAPLAQYLALLDHYGMTNAVIVQPSFLGSDNSFLLSALHAQPQRLRGIVVIDPETDLHALADMKDSGCVGIRLNLIGLPDPDLTGAIWQRALLKLKDLDWLVEIQVEAARLEAILNPILRSGVRIVVDHFGRPDPGLGVNSPGFQYLLSVGKTRRVWVKLSGAYRNGPDGRGEEIAMQAMPLLREAFDLNHLVWGSDWPHTQFEKTTSYEAAYQLLLKLLPKEGDRQIILWDSSAQLFGFSHQAVTVLAPDGGETNNAGFAQRSST